MEGFVSMRHGELDWVGLSVQVRVYTATSLPAGGHAAWARDDSETSLNSSVALQVCARRSRYHYSPVYPRSFELLLTDCRVDL
jgi:hypothetical protein